MKKQLILGFLLVVFLFTFTACKRRTNEDVKPQDNPNPNAEKEGGINATESEELVSDGTKLVFEQGNTKYVFYYTGETITAYKTYTDYQDAETAEGAYEFLKDQNLENVDRFYTEGKYLVYEFNESQYRDKTVEDIKIDFSYMTEVTR